MGKKGIIKIRYDKDMAKKLHEERQSAVVRNKEKLCVCKDCFQYYKMMGMEKYGAKRGTYSSDGKDTDLL